MRSTRVSRAWLIVLMLFARLLSSVTERAVAAETAPAHASQAAAAAPCVDPHTVTNDVTVDYGEKDHPERPNRVVFTRLPDGTLRAEDGVTRAELWHYAPPARLIEPGGSGPLGPIAVLRFDANDDGLIDPAAGDRIWLFFGLQNLGSAYIALDASSRTRARVLWIDDRVALPHLGLPWAQPGIVRLRIAGPEQNSEHLAVLLTGGATDGAAPGGEGNRIYAVDAATGALLWHAGATFDDDAPDLVLPQMTFGIAAPVIPLQLDPDGLVTRLYTADTGGQIWRLDLAPDQPVAQFASGGRIASLGLAESPPPGGPDARQFFTAPAVALIQPPGAPPYMSLAIGSGDAFAIDSKTTQDRIYDVRDFDPYEPLDAAGFAARRVLRDSDLPLIGGTEDAATLPPGAPGWKLNLQHDGEKILASGIIAHGVLMIPGFTPSTEPHECGQGHNRLFVLRVETGHAALDLNDDGVIDEHDTSVDLSQTNVAPDVRITLSMPAGNDSAHSPASQDVLGREVTCRAGVEAITHCAQPAALLRTGWRRESVR